MVIQSSWALGTEDHRSNGPRTDSSVGFWFRGLGFRVRVLGVLRFRGLGGEVARFRERLGGLGFRGSRTTLSSYKLGDQGLQLGA